MKRLIAAAIIIAFTAGIIIFGYISVTARCDTAVQNISRCRQEYKEDKKIAADTAAKILKDWQKDEQILAIFVKRDLLDEVEISLSDLHNAALCDGGDFYAKSDECELLIERIAGGEKLSLLSIF